MKILIYLTLVTTSVLMISCQGKSIKRGEPMLSEERKKQVDERETVVESAFASLPHFYCSNNCEGSGGDSEGFCPVCGNAYLHNAAFHDQGNASITQGTSEIPQAAQNSTGIWHYSCPNGHEGGANSAEACSECGTTMTHNAAYHEQGAASPASPSPRSLEPPQNALGLWHYVCPNGHGEGGGSGAETCSQCGNNFVHNSLYHEQSGATAGGTNPPSIGTPLNTTLPGSQPKTPEPAQNAVGTWHYTCKNGHEGGAGSAVACSECGTTLVHNGAYHSN